MAKPKSKTQKKTDNNMQLARTDACEVFLDEISGFQWLTHEEDYSNFPASLSITCAFNTDQSLKLAEDNEGTQHMQNLIQAKLLKIGVKLKAPKQQVKFEYEETLQ